MNFYIFGFFRFLSLLLGPPPLTTTTGLQSLFAGHGVQTKQQASSTSTSTSSSGSSDGGSSSSSSTSSSTSTSTSTSSSSSGGRCGGGPWNNTWGSSLCLQVEVVVGGGGLGTTHGAPVFVCRWRLLWGGGPWNNTRGSSLCLQVEVVVGGALEQHTGLQSLFAGGGCCGGGPWNNRRGSSLCLQVEPCLTYRDLSCCVRLVT